MAYPEDLLARLVREAGKRARLMVAIAGPPGAGKSTLAARLHATLPAGESMVVAMDGFHYDDRVLELRGLRARKGAPETFDFAGFHHLLQRLRANAEPEIVIPVFDRAMELSRAGAAIVPASARIVLVEGNYLLLNEAPWTSVAPLFDFTVMLDVPRPVLERRLVERWRLHGKSDEDGLAWIRSNDQPNIERVLSRQRPADCVLRTGFDASDQVP